LTIRRFAWEGCPIASQGAVYRLTNMPGRSSHGVKVSKRQTNRLRVPFLAPEDESVSKEAILERFEKYTLSGDGKHRFQSAVRYSL